MKFFPYLRDMQEISLIPNTVACMQIIFFFHLTLLSVPF